MSIFSKILRAGEGRAFSELEELTNAVNDLEAGVESLSDSELQAKTPEFRNRFANGASMEEVEVEAFAVVREAARRVLGMRPFDVQIVGGGALHRGMIAEMKTGEGKTLVATMPSYLNALTGNGVHVVTVNDYLASRDAEWMGGVHRFLGLEVGLIQSAMTPAERRPAYGADITYGTNNEFGFDYLRDNMAMQVDQMVKRGHHFAIVDEVDSILVDEARTPLIISGRVADTAKYYRDFARIVDRLRVDEHFEIDEAKRQVVTTEEGVTRVEEILGVENMYDYAAVDLVHHLDVALKSQALYRKDVDYLVDNGEVKIVDEFTGRVLEGRRYSEGLHQAIEAKEGVKIKEENQTLATITLQNYFRMYEKLAGMTGTAKTEAAEFAEIYGLVVVEIPTNQPIARADQPDLVYKTEEAKFNALIDDVTERSKAGQPSLVGTVSIERSERLSTMLRKRGVKHEVLNAKQHTREAEIIAQAGRVGAVTVATNMAGRGVDILLGGNPDGLAKGEMKRTGLIPGSPEYKEGYEEAFDRIKRDLEDGYRTVVDAGGLYVVGTERHESRRIDNQLRGRGGRQGDPGESRFYLSLEDELMRRFQGERVASIMERLRMPEDMPIEAKMVSKSIERAQGQVESQNFEIRKNVLKYDEVMNKQRQVIYKWRSGLLEGGSSQELADEWVAEDIEETVQLAKRDQVSPSEWDWDELVAELTVLYPTEISAAAVEAPGGIAVVDVVETALAEAHTVYEQREEEFGSDVLRQIERNVILSIIDNKWREHLAEMDYLRAGIGLRAMGQRDPLVEYQREGFDMFAEMVDAVKRDSVRYLFHAQLAKREEKPKLQVSSGGGQASSSRGPVQSDKVGRNDPCPCGSGKKYKKCHGAAA
jgi:preprotein translocase subunit SecA